MSNPLPGIQINATNVSVATGDHSSATTHVTQISQGARLDELLPLLAELRSEIAQLGSAKLRDGLTAQAAQIDQAVADKAPDAKARITDALKNIKLVADAADGTDKLLKLISRVSMVAAPILASLF